MTTVCILTISVDKHGDDVYVCADSGVARLRLEKYVDEWWDESMALSGEVAEKPGDRDEKIERYFEVVGGSEGYEISLPGEVIGAETKHTSMYGAILGVITSLRERTSAAEYTDVGDAWDCFNLIEDMAKEGLGEV